MVFENGVKNIQAAAYNGARAVDKYGKVHENYIFLYNYGNKTENCR